MLDREVIAVVREELDGVALGGGDLIGRRAPVEGRALVARVGEGVAPSGGSARVPISTDSLSSSRTSTSNVTHGLDVRSQVPPAPGRTNTGAASEAGRISTSTVSVS
ncbi:MAG: hypothetical protein M5U28_34750 [Sandaracinaceae bacterium]|nr:hypothetical protein [Sandaracinaceae bacterium]